MDIRTISSHNYIPVIDPVFLKQSPDEFLAENGGFLSEVAVIGKSSSGFVHYRSTTAPTDRDTNEFFSTFSTIADSIGIKVYGFVNGLADSFLASNPGYSAIKDGGNPNVDFVDPFKTSYTNYLKSITTEIIGFPVKGLVLDNIRFPREVYSFCENCCRRFSERYGIERIFSLTDLQKDATLLNQWLTWRKDAIENILREMSENIQSKKAIDLDITIDIDPTLDAEKGALKHFGQDISVIGKYGNPTIHLSAWTPLPNAVDTPEYQTLLKSLIFAKNYQTQTKLNLFIWGVENESIVPIIDALKEELSINRVYIQNHFPIDYQKRREIHMGLV
jgi:hypothetical protein